MRKGILGKPLNVEKPPSAWMTCTDTVMGEEGAEMKLLTAGGDLGEAGQADPERLPLF